jgi:hypothetical protein
MKRQLSIWIMLLLSGLVCSCVDEIAFPASDGRQVKLVVEGRAVKGAPSRIFVQLSQTADLGVHSTPVFVEDADIRLRDRAGESTGLVHQSRGYYTAVLTPDSPVNLQAGQSYQLEITLSDGRRYQSAWEPLTAVPEMDSIGFTEIDKRTLTDAGNIVNEPFIEFQITTPLIPDGHTEPVPLLWEAEGVYKFHESQVLLFPRICYISERVDNGRVKVLSEPGNDQVALVRYPLLEKELTWRFATGYYLTLYQYSLSRSAGIYWSQVAQIIQRDGGLFETPPGAVPGNISNPDDPDEQVLGYFFASAVDTARLLVLPDELSHIIRGYCDPGFGESEAVCLDCLLWPRSTLERPAYW